MDLLHQAEDKLIGEDSVLAPLYFYTQKYMLADGIEGMYYCHWDISSLDIPIRHK